VAPAPAHARLIGRTAKGEDGFDTRSTLRKIVVVQRQLRFSPRSFFWLVGWVGSDISQLRQALAPYYGSSLSFLLLSFVASSSSASASCDGCGGRPRLGFVSLSAWTPQPRFSGRIEIGPASCAPQFPASGGLNRNLALVAFAVLGPGDPISGDRTEDADGQHLELGGRDVRWEACVRSVRRRGGVEKAEMLAVAVSSTGAGP
jgi:hypothetical protein